MYASKHTHTCTYIRTQSLQLSILISFEVEEEGSIVADVVVGRTWGGDSEVLASEVMKLVKSMPPKSLIFSEGSMADCNCDSAAKGNADDVKGLVDDGSAEPGVGSIGKERRLFCILCVYKKITAIYQYMIVHVYFHQEMM